MSSISPATNNEDGDYNTTSSDNLNGTIATVSILLFLAITSAYLTLHLLAKFLYARFLRRIANRHSHQQASDTPETLLQNSQQQQQGLDKASINRLLPTFKLNSSTCSSSSSASECAVCLTEFQANDILRLLPSCRHSFHAQCIDIWFFSHSTCPLCRTSALPPSQPSDLQLPSDLAVGSTDHGDHTVIDILVDDAAAEFEAEEQPSEIEAHASAASTSNPSPCGFMSHGDSPLQVSRSSPAGVSRLLHGDSPLQVPRSSPAGVSRLQQKPLCSISRSNSMLSSFSKNRPDIRIQIPVSTINLQLLTTTPSPSNAGSPSTKKFKSPSTTPNSIRSSVLIRNSIKLIRQYSSSSSSSRTTTPTSN